MRLMTPERRPAASAPSAPNKGRRPQARKHKSAAAAGPLSIPSGPPQIFECEEYALQRRRPGEGPHHQLRKLGGRKDAPVAPQ